MGYAAMKDLERYVDLIVASQTAQEAFDHFCDAMRKHGYDRIAYSLVNDHPSLGLFSRHGLATSYPEDWMKHYAAHNFSLIDPVTQRVLTKRTPFFWSDTTAKLDRLSPSLRMMDEAADAGLGDGIGISLRGDGTELVGVGIARSSLPASERNKPQDYNLLGGAYLLSTCLHETYRDLTIKTARAVLSAREHDVLSWGAEGKTDEDISMILIITVNTVRFHWKNIFKKLAANGRTYAITKALRQQIITPASMRAPYQKR
jgi:DNA-binding CsgD family transcriptional regulator